MKKECSPKQGGLEPPNCLILDDDSCIIFENKDIRIGGDEIEPHDFDSIINIYSNKLYLKKWKWQSGQKVQLDETKERRIGITQLTDHIANIRKGNLNMCRLIKKERFIPFLFCLILNTYTWDLRILLMGDIAVLCLNL